MLNTFTFQTLMHGVSLFLLWPLSQLITVYMQRCLICKVEPWRTRNQQWYTITALSKISFIYVWDDSSVWIKLPHCLQTSSCWFKVKATNLKVVWPWNLNTEAANYNGSFWQFSDIADLSLGCCCIAANHLSASGLNLFPDPGEGVTHRNHLCLLQLSEQIIHPSRNHLLRGRLHPE